MWGDGCSNDLALFKKKNKTERICQTASLIFSWINSLDRLAVQLHSFLPLAWADSEPVSPDSTLRSRSPCSAPGGEGLQRLAGEHGHCRRRRAGCFSGWLHLHFLWKWQTRACKNLRFQFLISAAKLLQFPEFYFHRSSCKACWNLLPLVCRASDENSAAE